MERNRKITSWRPLHGAALVGLFALAAIAPAFGSPPAVKSFVAPSSTRPPRVLLMGDSVMDQQGNAAAFLLRQAGVDAKAEGWWGSSLLTTDQYDYGKTKPGGVWLKEAARLVATFNPDVVAVYLNHNYWPPFPHDPAGRTIEDLWSAPGQSMIRQQVTALLHILRSRGARVYFVTPIPAGGANLNPDPNVWNPVWHGYLPVLRSLHVPLIDSGRVIEAPNGLRAETKPDCTGAPSRVRPPANLHLTRFGAGVVGTVDARAIANGLRVDLNDDVAPGDRTVALVPSPNGGYWLVACDGSIYHFGGAVALPGAHSRVAARRGGVVGAVATATGDGLWLVTADGAIVNVGAAPPIRFAARPTAGVVDVAPTRDHAGLFAVARDGAVATAGDARNFGSVAGRALNGSVLGIAATPDGKGYWLVGSDGGIFSFGDARFFGSMGATKLNGPIAALAPTPDGKGYWLVGRDGGIFAFGDARYSGNGRWIVPAYPKNLFTPAPGPIVDVVGAPGPRQGYWTLNDTGRVTNHGAATGHAGDSNLALSTQ